MRNIFDIVLTESKHGESAAKVLRAFGAGDGIDADRVVSAVAREHGVPRDIVPAALHWYGAADEVLRTDPHMQLSSAVRGSALNRTVGRYQRGDVSYITKTDMEGALDQARLWHGVATHRDGQHALDMAALRMHDLVGADEERTPAHSREAVERLAPNFSPTVLAAHRVLSARRAAYNPLASRTWRPTELDLPHDPVFKAHMAERPDTASWSRLPHAQVVEQESRELLEHAHSYLESKRGIKPSIPHVAVAEHTAADGTKFRGYTLDTPAKADDRCWGSRYCISTAGHAESMNKMYHGGVYKPVHLITKVGEDGQERLHAAYLPELLRGSAVRPDPDQAVRNSANNGPVRGEAFHKIHPLLSKLDGRIDEPSAHQPYVA